MDKVSNDMFNQALTGPELAITSVSPSPQANMFDKALTGIKSQAPSAPREPQATLFDYTLTGVGPAPDDMTVIGEKTGITIEDLAKLVPDNKDMNWVDATKAALSLNGDIYLMETLAELASRKPVFIESQNKKRVVIWNKDQLSGVKYDGYDICPIWKIYKFLLEKKAWPVTIGGKRSLLVGYEPGVANAKPEDQTTVGLTLVKTPVAASSSIRFWDIAKLVSDQGMIRVKLLDTEYKVDWNVPASSTDITPVWKLEKIFAMKNEGDTVVINANLVTTAAPVDTVTESGKQSVVTLTPVDKTGAPVAEKLTAMVREKRMPQAVANKKKIVKPVTAPKVVNNINAVATTTEAFYAHNTAHVEKATPAGPGVNTDYGNTFAPEAKLGLNVPVPAFGIGIGPYVGTGMTEGLVTAPMFDDFDKFAQTNAKYVGIAETMSSSRGFTKMEPFYVPPEHRTTGSVIAY